MNRAWTIHIGILLMVAIPAGIQGCGGGGGAGTPPGPGAIASVAVSPSVLAIEKGKSQLFSANAFDALGNPVSSSYTWSLSYSTGATASGSISATGRYQAPSTLPDDNLVTVQATSNIDPSRSGSVSFFLSTGASVTFQNQADVSAPINSQGLPIGLKMASARGMVHLAWVTADQGNGTHLWYSKGDKNGLFSSPHDVLNDVSAAILAIGTNTPSPENPSIITDGTNIFIAWDDTIISQYQVYLVKGVIGPSISFAPYATNNTNTSLLVETSANQEQRPSMAAAPGGKIEMAWEVLNGSEYTIHYIELDTNGAISRSSDVPATANPNFQRFSSIASDLNGNISIAWRDDNAQGLTPSIYYSGWPAAGQGGFTSPKPVETVLFTQSDSYSMALDTGGVPYLVWSITSGQASTINIYSATDTGTSFSAPAFRENGSAPTLKLDLLNRSDLSWYDPLSQSVNFIKGNLAFQSSSSYQISGANPVMDIDEGGRVNMMFTTLSGQNISTWFTRGE